MGIIKLSMKKVIKIILVFIIMLSIENVMAKTINSSDISASTYVIGRYVYTRDVSSETGYDGRLTTKRIMLAARTITGTTEESMVIYYKTASGSWINALTGEGVSVPETFEIDVEDLVVEGEVTTSNPNYETYELDSSEIDSSTYVIGDYIYTRNQNESHGYDGKLTTQRIMLASKTITGTTEEGMIIYYKTARGVWIDALTGVEVTAPQQYNISVVDLINQKTEEIQGKLLSGSEFNRKIKTLAGHSSAEHYSSDTSITKIKKASAITQENMQEENIISSDDSGVTIYAWFDEGTIYYYPYHYFDNVNVYLNEDSSNMFSYLTELTEIDLDSLYTSKTTNMASMFDYCGKLVNINLTNFDTSKVTNMSYMFFGSSNLVSLDLSSFDMSNVTNTTSMLGGNMISTITTPKVNSQETIALAYKMYDSIGNEYTEINTSTPTKTILNMPAILKTGSEFNTIIKRLAGNSDADHNTLDENITRIIRETNENNIPSNFVINSNNTISTTKGNSIVYAWYDNGTIYYYSKNPIIYLNSSSANMFIKLKNVIEIDLSGVDTSEVTSMVSMFSQSSSLESIDLSGVDTSKLEDISYMFYGCTSLTRLNLSKFDLGKVINSSNMLPSTGLISIVTPKVNANQTISLYNTLYDNSGNEYAALNSETPTETELHASTSLIYGSAFNVKIKKLAGNSDATDSTSDENITKIKRENNVNNVPVNIMNNDDHIISSSKSYEKVYAWFDNGIIYYYSASPTIYLDSSAMSMFKYLRSVTEIDLASFDTSRVSNMREMFAGCQSLTSLDLSHFDTSNVNSMWDMFNYCENLISLNLSSFNTSNVIYMDTMFAYCKKLTSLNLSSFNTSNVTGMSSMFASCNSLTSLNLSSFNTSSVKTMYRMFEGCSLLTNLNLSNFVTSNVTDMSRMFALCEKLTSLDLSNFNTSKVTDMSLMFRSCTNLVNLNLSSFDTSKVTGMRGMFYNCSNLNVLDLSKFDMSNVTNVNSMFDDSLIMSIKTPSVGPTLSVSLPYTLYDSNGNSYNELNASTPTNTQLTMHAILLSGWNFNAKIKVLAGDGSGAYHNTSDTNITKIKRVTNVNSVPSNVINNDDNLISISKNDKGVYAWFDNGIIYYYSESSTIYLNSDSRGMFMLLKNLVEIDLDSFNTGAVTNMSEMFYECNSISNLNLTGFDTSNVTSMYYMFFKCSNLNNLDLSSFDMSKVTEATSMFKNTPIMSLKTPRVNSNQSIELVYTLFDSSGNSYNELNVSTPTRTQLTMQAIMLSGENFNKKIKELAGNSNAAVNVDDENITKVKRVTDVNSVPSNVIGNDNHLVSISKNDKGVYAWYSSGIIYYYSESTTIYLNGDSSNMFRGLKNVIEIEFNGIDTSGVTNMASMFSGCNSLPSLNLSNFDTSNVTRMDLMFFFCSSLTSLNLSNFNTNQVTDMWGMFSCCRSLSNINLSSFNTSNVTRMDSMFYQCLALTSVNISNFNTENVVNMSRMFRESGLTSIDLSNFNTKNVTDMSYMFSICRSLASVDLSKFDMSKLANGEYMFVDSVVTTIVTPKVNPNISIDLSRTMYAQGNSTGITAITSTTPLQTTLKSTTW